MSHKRDRLAFEFTLMGLWSQLCDSDDYHTLLLCTRQLKVLRGAHLNFSTHYHSAHMSSTVGDACVPVPHLDLKPFLGERSSEYVLHSETKLGHEAR